MAISKKVIQCFLVLAAALASVSTLAAIQMHSFTVSGDNGETGSGFFTYDDQTVLDGDQIGDLENTTGDLLSLELTISGGNVVGGQTAFTLSDCFGAIMEVAPEFVDDINLWCDNGSNSLRGVEEFTNEFNDGDSTLTFVPGASSPAPAQPSTPVPALPMGGLVILAGLAGLFGARKLRKAAWISPDRF